MSMMQNNKQLYKVVLIDDEPFVLKGLSMLINWEKYGFEICGKAKNGEQGIYMINKLQPHLVITDIKMPGLDGFEVIKDTYERLQTNTKFIILSGYDEFSYAKKAMKYNVKNYILKPIDEDELIQDLKEIYSDITKEINIKNKQDNDIKFIVNNTINRIISGEKKENVIERANFLMDIKKEEQIQCVLIEIDNYENWMDELEENEIENNRDYVRKTIEDTLENKNTYNIFDYSINCYGIIITEKIKLGIGCTLEYFLKKLQKKIEGQCNSTVSIFISDKRCGIHSLEQCYKDILTAQSYKFFRGKNTIIFYEDIKNNTLKLDFDKINSISNLIDNIENNNKESIIKNINNLFNEFLKELLSPSVVKIYMDNISVEIIKLIQQMNGHINDIIKSPFISQEDINKYTINEIKNELIKFCIDSMEYMNNLRKSNANSITNQIEEYVRKNYDKSLKIKDIAEKFHINSVYLGQLFKKSTNMYFNQFLNNIRIEEAKKLLRRTDMKIYEIAFKVGYKNADYFISKFEKETSISPLEYKKSYQETN